MEPFFGGGAVLLHRPHVPGIETVNDLDGFVANAWRAISADPAGTAAAAAWPCNEADLHARHLWLRARREALTARLMADPAYYDCQIAGWWLWGIALWIGGGWCGEGGSGPWGVVEAADGHAVFGRLPDGQSGVSRQRPHLTHAGHGVSRQIPHLGHAGHGVSRKIPHLGHAGHGVSRQRPHLGFHGSGIAALGADLVPWFAALQARLRRVRVCCGDWARIMGESVLTQTSPAGVVLDPPYGGEVGRTMGLYAAESGTVAADVRAWCVAHGADRRLRIVLCGYGDEHDALLAHGWAVEAWRTGGGYGNQGDGRGKDNAVRERLWFSPACLGPEQPRLL